MKLSVRDKRYVRRHNSHIQCSSNRNTAASSSGLCPLGVAVTPAGGDSVAGRAFVFVAPSKPLRGATNKQQRVGFMQCNIKAVPFILLTVSKSKNNERNRWNNTSRLHHHASGESIITHLSPPTMQHYSIELVTVW